MVEFEPEPNRFRPASTDGALVVWTDGTVAAVNVAGAALLGASPAELVGRDLHDIAAELHCTTADGTAFAECPTAEVLLTRLPVRDVAVHVTRADGSVRHLSLSCRPQVHRDEVVSVACTFRDVTVTSGAHGEPAEQRHAGVDAADLFSVDLSTLPDVPPLAPVDSPWARRSA